MNAPAKAPLAVRQQRLLVRSALLRASLAQDLVVLEAPLAWADRAREAVGWLQRHRELLIAGAAVLALLRPRRALRWAGRGWWWWRVARRARPWLLTAWALAQRPPPRPPLNPGA